MTKRRYLKKFGHKKTTGGHLCKMFDCEAIKNAQLLITINVLVLLSYRCRKFYCTNFSQTVVIHGVGINNDFKMC